MERSTIFNGTTHYKWPYSIASHYQRVLPFWIILVHHGTATSLGEVIHHSTIKIIAFFCVPWRSDGPAGGHEDGAIKNPMWEFDS
jgi:hypothetical protein